VVLYTVSTLREKEFAQTPLSFSFSLFLSLFLSLVLSDFEKKLQNIRGKASHSAAVSFSL